MNDDKNKAGVPEGWKLVPVEPTREILHAMAVMSNDGFRAAYAAMLAAATQPPAAEVGELSSIDTPEFRAMVSEFINAPALFGQSAAKAAWGRIVDYITVWGSAQPALAAPQPPAAESRAQAAGVDERAAFEAWFVAKQFGGMRESMWASWEARAAIAATPSEQRGVTWDDQAALTVMNMVGDGPYGESDVREAVHFLKAAETVRSNLAASATPSEAAPAGRGDQDTLNKLRQLCNGGPFDLTDSPKSFMAQVSALLQPTKDE